MNMHTWGDASAFFLLRIRVDSARQPATAKYGNKTGCVQTAALCELPSNLQLLAYTTPVHMWLTVTTMRPHSQHCVYHKQCMIIYKCSFKHIWVSVIALIECYICTVWGNEFQVVNWLDTLFSFQWAWLMFNFTPSYWVQIEWIVGHGGRTGRAVIPYLWLKMASLQFWYERNGNQVLWWVCWVSGPQCVNEGMPPGDVQSSLCRGCFILAQHLSTFHDYNY